MIGPVAILPAVASETETGLRSRIFLMKSRVKAPAARLARRGRGFTFNGRRLPYFVHPYYETWRTERAVEIPLALEAIERHRSGRVLEVGNVLAHYGLGGHEVIDRYESGSGVRNEDVVEARLDGRYDVIVSISTLEHVGFDEDVEDPRKPVTAVEHLAEALAPGGELFVTVPLGYNHALDAALADDAFAFDEIGYLRRRTAANDWEQVGEHEARRWARYGYPFNNANVIAAARRGRPA